MSSNKRESGQVSEFENGSHLARKKKALDTQFSKKNQRELINFISLSEDDDEDGDLAKYVRYLK